jgi:hypothetical protein
MLESGRVAAREDPMDRRAYEIQGQTVKLPVVVRDASAAVATWLVPAAAAQRLVPAPFVVAQVLPGRTPLAIAAIDYRDNDLGDYDEVSITFFVRPKGAPAGIPYLGALFDLLRGRLGTFIHALPVNQSFTCDAGRTIWGFPKSVQEIAIDSDARRAMCRLSMDGQHVLTLCLPRGGGRSLPNTDTTTYTLIEGVPHRTRFSQGGSGVGFSLGGARIQLGSHPLAEALRTLGLPKRALMSMWTEHMHGRFEAPEKL